MCLSLYLLNAGLSCENQKPNRIHSLTGVKGSRKEVSRPLRATTELVVCVEFEWRTVGCVGECVVAFIVDFRVRYVVLLYGLCSKLIGTTFLPAAI